MQTTGHASKRRHVSPDDSSSDPVVSTSTLKTILRGLEDIDDQLQKMQKRVVVLRDLLAEAARHRMVSSLTVTEDDLTHAGFEYNILHFNSQKIANLAKSFIGVKSVDDLYTSLQKIFRRVNLNRDEGNRMVIHTILLALPDICQTEGRCVGILPGVQVSYQDDNHLQLVQRNSKFRLWIPDQLDYVAIEYDDQYDNTERIIPYNSPDVIRAAIGESRGRFLLVEGKRPTQSYTDPSEDYILYDNIPEAICQAIALLKFSGLKESEVRFCLTDGQKWLFFILQKMEDGQLVYYQSLDRDLSIYSLRESDFQLRELLVILREWLKPTESEAERFFAVGWHGSCW
ncbi:hypothetical protein C8Q75DRAFT_546155 [Abortiporus biennis]|nr:hypothetical protein C8Q75DRAFT_546155 [Abortiporus biennis]